MCSHCSNPEIELELARSVDFAFSLLPAEILREWGAYKKARILSACPDYKIVRVGARKARFL